MFAIVICLVCINSQRYVCCSECDVVSNECNEPTSCLVQPIGAHCCEVMYFGCFGFRGQFGFLNCDDVCMCVVNKQFELLEFVSEFIYVDLQYDEISLTFTAGTVCLCGVSSPVVVLGLFVRLSYYPMLCVRLLKLFGCVISICCVGFASLDVVCDELNDCAWNVCL